MPTTHFLAGLALSVKLLSYASENYFSSILGRYWNSKKAQRPSRWSSANGHCYDHFLTDLMKYNTSNYFVPSVSEKRNSEQI